MKKKGIQYFPEEEKGKRKILRDEYSGSGIAVT